MNSSSNALPSIAPFVRMRDVLSALQINRKTLVTWIQDGHFPMPIRMGNRGNVFWEAKVIRDFLDKKKEEANGQD
jgi:predicted DNA-binding transcriptional regulator AlpA